MTSNYIKSFIRVQNLKKISAQILKKDQTSFVKVIDYCTNTWCTKKKGTSKIAFLENLSNSKKNQFVISQNSVGSHQIRKTSADLHQNQMVLSIDKASYSVAIIRKRFYTLTLIKELNFFIGNSNNNKNYGMIKYDQ